MLDTFLMGIVIAFTITAAAAAIFTFTVTCFFLLEFDQDQRSNSSEARAHEHENIEINALKGGVINALKGVSLKSECKSRDVCAWSRTKEKKARHTKYQVKNITHIHTCFLYVYISHFVPCSSPPSSNHDKHKANNQKKT
ncbi:hypothetical protein QVD17_20525 [Tagetes erecta]|uniref:Uncharacterized protein n=1 Tax=Tagetes erecta TaxID=13708 RepID=A0AAD8NY78_TARER|nr:hypothetical protein QVD17_20525 [Tagetes erecta]